MLTFNYQALNAQGKKLKGKLSAANLDEAHYLMHQQGLLPIKLEPESTSAISKLLKPQKIKDADLAWLTRQLASLVSAQVPLENALTVAIEQSHNRQVKYILQQIRDQVRAGQRFAHALQEYPNIFPTIYCALIDAGEQSGELEHILNQLADYIEQRNALRNKLLTAFIYPVLVSIVSLAIIVFLLSYVVPQVVGAFAQTKQSLPTLTVVMLWLSALVKNWGIYFVGLIAALLVALSYALKKPELKLVWDQSLLRLPLLGEYLQGIDIARFASTLAILSSSSVPLLQALETAGKTIKNSKLRDAVTQATGLVKEGSPLWRALNQQACFPALLIHLIQSGEKTGNVAEMLQRAAKTLSAELEVRATTTTAILEPLMILMMGGFVLLIVLAVMMPIIQLNQLIV